MHNFKWFQGKKGWNKKPIILWAAGYSLQPGGHLQYKKYKYEQPDRESAKSKIVSDAGEFQTDIEDGEVFTFVYQRLDQKAEKVCGPNKHVYALGRNSWTAYAHVQGGGARTICQRVGGGDIASPCSIQRGLT